MASIWTSDAQAAQQGFDESYYLSAKAALLTSQTGSTWTVDMVKASFASAGLQAYEHYQQYGFKEGLNPNAYFNNSYYDSSKAAASGSTESAFQTAWNNVNGGSQTSTYFHYLQYGFNEAGVNPSATFNEAQYYTDKAALLTAQTGQTWTVAQVEAAFASAGLTPITHYMLYGGTPNEPTPQPVHTGDYSLTVNPDVATANVFDSVPAWTSGGNVLANTLQNFDHLTGTGTNPTLNVQLGDSSAGSGTTITPTLTGIQTINAAFIGSTGPVPPIAAVNTIDMQDATGATSLNITRISDGNNAAFTNIASVPTTLSLSNTNSPAGTVTFRMLDSAVSGDADTTTMTLNNANVGTLTIQGTTAGFGVETVNLESSTSANAITNVLNVDDIKVLNISGSQNLSINNINYGAADGDFTTINGSTATGSLTLTVNDNLNTAMVATTGTGANVDFSLKTGSGDDTLKVTTVSTGANGGVIGQVGDTIDMGTGTDTVAFSSHSTSLAGVGTIENIVYTNKVSAGFAGVENITLTRNATEDVSTPAAAPVATSNSMTVDSDRLAGDQAISLVNKGGLYQAPPVPGSSVTGDGTATFVLNNLSATEAATGITIAHSSTSNNGLANTVIAAGTTGATLGVTIADGLNSDPRFNLKLNATTSSVVNMTIHDTDSESNSVSLIDSTGANTVDGITGIVTVTGGSAGKFMNLDAMANTGGTSVTAQGMGIDTTGTSVDYAPTDTMGNIISHVFIDNNTANTAERFIASNITATDALSDVIVRVGAATQTIQMGAGNDTVIFDALNDNTAGLTILDTVKGGAGSDTLVIDGDFAGTIALGASEWTNLSGIDTLRMGINAAAGGNYALTITDQLVGQTDNGTTLNIINNDGIVGNNAESNLTVNMTGLSATKFVNFYGANGDSDVGFVQTNVNRVIMSDANANGGHILNGGDADLHSATANPTFVANNNVYEVRDSAVVTAGDLAHVSNFGTIVFNNDQAVTQTLTLNLTDTVVDAMAQASHTAATTAGNVETLWITANDGTVGSVAGAALNVDASAVGAQFSLVITGDTVNTAADIIKGGAGADTITGALGADVMTGNGGADIFNYGTLATVSAQTGITLATADTITDFTTTVDHIKTGTAGTAANYAEAGSAATFAAAQAAADAAMDGTVRYYLTDTAADGGLLFVDSNGDGTADAVIKLTGITSANFDFADISA